MKREYTNPMITLIVVDSIDTATVSNVGDGIIVDLGNLGKK